MFKPGDIFLWNGFTGWECLVLYKSNNYYYFRLLDEKFVHRYSVRTMDSVHGRYKKL